jgi:hypothetical protein
MVLPPTPTPRPSAAVMTSTRLPTASSVPSATPLSIVIVSATPSATATQTPLVTDTPTATPTLAGTLTPQVPTDIPPIRATQQPNTTAAPISIVRFTIQPAEVRPGEAVTLAWEAVAEQATLWRVSADGRLAELFAVPVSGTLVISIPPEQRNRIEFALFATAGASTAQATVSARVLCPDAWFFANGPPECPAGPAHATLMAAERFERGLMLWTQYDDRIHVLYNGGAMPRWDTLANGWFPGQPEDDPALTPPAGLFQPRRGFGLAWRTGYVSPTQVVRDRLGWATEPEFEIANGYYQCDAGPSYSRCYLTGPGGVYVLEPERAGWRLIP